MNLYVKCPNCKHETRFKSDAATRVEYAMKNGKIKELNCTNCNKNHRIQINKIYAKESKLAYLIAGLIFSFGSLFVILFWFKMLTNTNSNFGLYAIGLILLIPVWIYLIINKQERMRVNTFNHAYVKETMID